MGTTAHSIYTSRRKKKSDWHRHLGKYIAIPHEVLKSYRYRTLSTRAQALLPLLLLQLNGFNNGDICAAQTILEPFGWTNSTRKRALKELEENELLVCTRHGYKGRASLYAVTWLPINEFEGKLELSATSKPLINYPKENNSGAYKINAGPPAAQVT